MSTFYKAKRGRRPSSTDWLEILDVDGPFLAAPVVHDTWPDGLPALSQTQMDALRSASTLYDANPGTRDAFISHVLTATLDWRHNLATGPDAATQNVAVPEHHQTVEISFALRAQAQDGGVQNTPLLLGVVLPSKTATTGRAPAGSGTWTAGPADRLAHALRMRKVPLGIVTNGDTWTLVTVSDGGAVSTATWTRYAWLEEPQTLRAFVALLTRTRFYGVPDDETLPGLLTKSLARQEEVTERLAEQSQAVVEMLVATLGRLDARHQAEHGSRLLPPDVGPAEVYQAAVTVLMRLVFLLYAEERGLLPLDDDTYASAYAVNTLADSLRDRATDHGEDALERTATGWYRLLALFRGVHRGARHEQLILPAYGGSLFDPDRFPWLEGRASADLPLGSGDIPAIDDRTLLKALDSLQTLQFAKERRQVSYRSLDVEQIGYVYEGLLDQDALMATDWVVSIAVSDKDPRKNGPELLLTELEHRQAQGGDVLATWLVEQIKNMKGNRSKTSILKALIPLEGDDKPRYERLVREACGNDDEVTARVLPFAKLLRLDPRDLPVAYPPGSLYLTDSAARANTGAVYTPRFLAEHVVETTLEAIVYSPGPLDTEDKSEWVLKSPEQILSLKICDIAAGSGAFLVAATRYLADRLVESRRQSVADTSTAAGPDQSSVSDGGERQTVLGLQEIARLEQDEVDARRAIVDHCIYGVDINPMAIEMAKLSLWLTTLDRNRPFGFLDDRLAVGDCLLGITSADQLRALHLEPMKGRELLQGTLDLFNVDTDGPLRAAAELRRQIAAVDLRDTRDGEHKRRLLRRAEELTTELSLVADGICSAAFAGGSASDYLALRAVVKQASTGSKEGGAALADFIRARLHRDTPLPRRPAHYPLLFPEVFEGGGAFDAVIGNPPFLAGTRISGSYGQSYFRYLSGTLPASGDRADLVAYIIRRTAAVATSIGLIASRTAADTDSATIGLRYIIEKGFTIFRATGDMPWPTHAASQPICLVAATAQAVEVSSILDGVAVTSINEKLRDEAAATRAPVRLSLLRDVSHEGIKPAGQGFLLDAASVERVPAYERRAVAPLLNGDDIYGSEVISPVTYIIDFSELDELRAAREFPYLYSQVLQKVKPERLTKNRSAHRDNWWLWGERRRAMRLQFKNLTHYWAMPRVSNTLVPVQLPTEWLPSEALVVYASASMTLGGCLASSLHAMWVYEHCSRRGSGMRHTPSDCCAYFPWLPLEEEEPEVVEAMGALQLAQAEACATFDVGLTGIYTRLAQASDARSEAPLASLLDAQLALDSAAAAALGLPGVTELCLQATPTTMRWLPDNRQQLLAAISARTHEVGSALSGVPSGGMNAHRSVPNGLF
jgi:hypothetical protein